MKKAACVQNTGLCFLFLALMILPFNSFAAENVKFGSIDIQKILNESESGKKAKSDLESLTGTRGIALVSGIWLTNFQKLKIPLYDKYFETVSKKFYEDFAKKMKQKNGSPPPTGLP